MDEPLATEGESAQRQPTRAAVLVACAAVAVALLIVTLAPGTRSVAPTQISVSPIVNDAVVEASGVGTPARLDFVLRDLNGVEVKLASFKGKVILLNFWATWCPPCRAEIPGLVELQHDLEIRGLL